MFHEQQTDPSPDCSLENSQLDLFDLISQFDIMSILKRGNMKKLVALEQEKENQDFYNLGLLRLHMDAQ